ncbi:MAG TPA: hypothetical protein VGD37_24405 [Kofleriaceae bacterium]
MTAVTPRDSVTTSPDRDAQTGSPSELAAELAIEDRLEPLITELVQSAPAADPAVVDELVGLLEQIGSPLARSIARVLELSVAQLIAPGVALPPLAMACATLADGIRGRLGDRELEAARYEIETLLPLPDAPPPVRAPDVPIGSLRKRAP